MIMATKKGQFAVCKELARHLRPKGRRAYWSSERDLVKKILKKLVY